MRVLLAEHHRYRSAVRVGSHQIGRVLLESGHEVVWLSHPRSWLHRLRGPLPPRELQHPDGVREVILRAPLPYVRWPGLDSLSWGRWWLRATPAARRRLRSLVREGCDLWWVSDFTALGLLDEVRCGAVAFRFFDRLDQFSWMPRSIYALARRYRGRADTIVASSRAVQRHLAGEGLDADYLPNGAHIRPGSRALAARSDRENLVVYVGAVEEWFDLPAVEHWARALPTTEFVIAGPVSARLSPTAPNVRFAGPIPYEDVPDLLARARAGVIPFRRNELTDGIHPLKLYEYLAAGCPVVSVDLPEVREVPGAVWKYRTPAEGLAQLRRCLAYSPDRLQLHALAAESSWSRRLAPLLARLERKAAARRW